MDGFLQPIFGMLDKLGINKTAEAKSLEADPNALSNHDLAKELDKMAGNMPEELAGQQMHDEKTPLDKPEEFPAKPTLENGKDGKYRLQQRSDDNLDNLKQTPAPLSRPEDLDTNQDPLATMAAKVASVIEPHLAQIDPALNDPARRVGDQLNKTAAPYLQMLRTDQGDSPLVKLSATICGRLMANRLFDTAPDKGDNNG